VFTDDFSENSSTGITLNVIGTGGNILVQYDSTSTGSNATIKYSITNLG
jgi:arginine decarboxylase-like protein